MSGGGGGVVTGGGQETLVFMCRHNIAENTALLSVLSLISHTSTSTLQPTGLHWSAPTFSQGIISITMRPADLAMTLRWRLYATNNIENCGHLIILLEYTFFILIS